jgi:hypothetical protein
MNSRGDEALWVRWWCNPWSWAHPTWQAACADRQGLCAQDCHALMARQPRVFLQCLGILPSQPPRPHEVALRWLMLTHQERQRAVALAQCICFAEVPAPGPDGPWCWSLTQALRPRRWLPCANGDARMLLGSWLGTECWSRLRLCWPLGELDESPWEAPENKLQALWQATMWRARAPCSVSQTAS